MLTVACVNEGDYLSMGKQYVETLRAMVARNLSQPFDFVCIEDAGGLKGWWAKIALFEPGRFKGRVLYTDLDSVITGNLDELADTKGIIDLHNWGWRTNTLCSAVMVWDAGEHAEIFEKYTPDVPQKFTGDQDWITHLEGWPILPAHLCRSYRYHSTKAPPADCVHVSFHGRPKPHEVTTGWVPRVWHTAPWTKNRAGECHLCGHAFGHYESKYVEIASPHRLMCSGVGSGECGHRAHGDVDERAWYYWTDG